jgi:beta-lactamase class A
MASHRIRAVCTALAVALQIPLLTATTASTTAPTVIAPTTTCASPDSALARRLRTHITAALSGRSGTVAVGLHDRTTGTTCTLRAGNTFDSASVVKVIVLATLLWDAEDNGRTLTKSEKSLATAMITGRATAPRTPCGDGWARRGYGASSAPRA